LLKFEWDETKAASNLAKHGVSFGEAASIFGDPMALTFNDPDHSEGERRYLTFGLSQMSRVLLVVNVERGSMIRIVSARKATKRERAIYEQG